MTVEFLANESIKSSLSWMSFSFLQLVPLHACAFHIPPPSTAQQGNDTCNTQKQNNNRARVQLQKEQNMSWCELCDGDASSETFRLMVSQQALWVWWDARSVRRCLPWCCRVERTAFRTAETASRVNSSSAKQVQRSLFVQLEWSKGRTEWLMAHRAHDAVWSNCGGRLPFTSLRCSNLPRWKSIITVVFNVVPHLLIGSDQRATVSIPPAWLSSSYTVASASNDLQYSKHFFFFTEFVLHNPHEHLGRGGGKGRGGQKNCSVDT